jgi:excisionase family DNA binding protein
VVTVADRLLLRIPEACEVAAISRSKLYELIESGAVPAVHVGRSIRVPMEGLRRWADAQPAVSRRGA